MEIVHFKPQSIFSKKAAETFEREKDKLSKIIPQANIEHIGSTAIPNSMTKGDLDIQIRVGKRDFLEAVEQLKKLYEINQPENWTEDYASFKDDEGNMPVGVQLTVKDSKDDKLFQEQQRLLSNNPEVLREYNAIKLGFEGKDIDEYRAARMRFFEGLKERGILN